MSGETVVRIRRGAATGVNRYGDTTYAATTRTNLPGAFFAPGGSVESLEVGREAVTTSPTLYFPGAWPDLLDSDHIEVRGVEYEADGNPADWRNPWGGSLGGLVVTLKVVEG